MNKFQERGIITGWALGGVIGLTTGTIISIIDNQKQNENLKNLFILSTTFGGVLTGSILGYGLGTIVSNMYYKFFQKNNDLIDVNNLNQINSLGIVNNAFTKNNDDLDIQSFDENWINTVFDKYEVPNNNAKLHQ